MNYEIVSYILIGSLFIAVMIPLIALIHKSNKEQKHLDEVKTAKKTDTPLVIKEYKQILTR